MIKTILSILIVIIINYCAYLLGHNFDGGSTNIVSDFMFGWGMLLSIFGFITLFVLMVIGVRKIFK